MCSLNNVIDETSRYIMKGKYLSIMGNGFMIVVLYVYFYFLNVWYGSHTQCFSYVHCCNKWQQNSIADNYNDDNDIDNGKKDNDNHC